MEISTLWTWLIINSGAVSVILTVLNIAWNSIGETRRRDWWAKLTARLKPTESREKYLERLKADPLHNKRASHFAMIYLILALLGWILTWSVVVVAHILVTTPLVRDPHQVPGLVKWLEWSIGISTAVTMTSFWISLNHLFSVWEYSQRHIRKLENRIRVGSSQAKIQA